MSKRPKKNKNISSRFDKFASHVTRVTGKPIVFILALGIIVGWGALGPIFNYSDTWQLVINTSTTIVTFLMVFVIQHAQNKESMAMQLKLNELLAATKGASNRVIDIEDLSDEELLVLKKFYLKLSKLAEKSSDIGVTHSIDEAEKNMAFKIEEK